MKAETFLSKEPKIQIKVYKKTVFIIMLSDSWKSANEKASGDPQNNIVKNYKKYEIAQLL